MSHQTQTEAILLVLPQRAPVAPPPQSQPAGATLSSRPHQDGAHILARTRSRALTHPAQLIFSVFKTLTDQVVTVELKNDLCITGTLKSVDQCVPSLSHIPPPLALPLGAGNMRVFELG
jgi:hypothetical protein